jgi:cupin 2 domain-containing protein
MAEAQYQQFLNKVRQLNAFVALSEADPELRQSLIACDHHHQVVNLAARHGFEIARRWGDDAGMSVTGADVGDHSWPDQVNLLSGACPTAGEEHTQTLLEGPDWRLERIHSCQAASPDDIWYDQSEHEWVLLLRGSARLQFADEKRVRDLCAGDSLLIEPHRRHRVVATDPAPGTLWLALFWRQDGH